MPVKSVSGILSPECVWVLWLFVIWGPVKECNQPDSTNKTIFAINTNLSFTFLLLVTQRNQNFSGDVYLDRGGQWTPLFMHLVWTDIQKALGFGRFGGNQTLTNLRKTRLTLWFRSAVLYLRRPWWLCMSSMVTLPHTPITNASISHSFTPRAMRK